MIDLTPKVPEIIDQKWGKMIGKDFSNSNTDLYMEMGIDHW